MRAAKIRPRSDLAPSPPQCHLQKPLLGEGQPHWAVTAGLGGCTLRIGQDSTPVTHKLVLQSRRRTDRPTTHAKLTSGCIRYRGKTKWRKGAVTWRDIGKRTEERGLMDRDLNK